MNNGNTIKAEQLGMSGGKANAILRKSILFKYVQLAGHDSCFVCHTPIESADEMSIEHKLPWQNRDVARFWDLDNISFSHRRCNVPHEYGAKRLQKAGPEGTAWCSGHRAFLSVESFHTHGERWNGLQKYCITCRIPGRKAQYVRDRAKNST